jgi:hypothetical protein
MYHSTFYALKKNCAQKKIIGSDKDDLDAADVSVQ